MPKYRNNNTGDEVEYDHPSPRLEMLPNWERLDAESEAEQDPAPEVERPNKSAPKAEWQAYARTRAQDSAEADEIDTLTKEQLVERYGSESED
ncbi:hypothetical protein ACWGDS_26045 [Streptomyces sp. NPDC055059]